MPEMHFSIEWPDGARRRCYSPSYVVEDHLAAGQAYPVAEFVRRVSSALEEASERVRAKYGFACSSAQDELARLVEHASALPPEARAGLVRVIAFEKHPSRDARASSARQERSDGSPEKRE